MPQILFDNNCCKVKKSDSNNKSTKPTKHNPRAIDTIWNYKNKI